ncbi:MAG: protein kinase [Planctomycetes bacterium]|nr:protein kinase [Planctomycetota bacterium]
MTGEAQVDGDDALVPLVEAFLELRAEEPGLSPEAFAADHPGHGARLLAALRAALEVEAVFDEGDGGLPERIGAYTVIREIGRGGMGVVYEVEKERERFALKRLGIAALLSPNAQARFDREVRALMRIRHAGVVAVHDAGVAGDVPFLVMDLVSGPSFASLGRLPWRRAVELCRQLADALVAIHAAGLLHRDLKPQNVLLAADDRPVIVDFGLVHDTEDVTLTGTGDLLGTPRYFAPEQAAGGVADARTDVHALGLVLAELLTGRPVREGSDRVAVLAEVESGRAPALGSIPDLPRGLVRLLRMATAQRPRWRYPTAAAMRDDLDRLLAGQPVRARPPGAVVRGIDAARHHPRRAIASGLGVVIAGVALGVSLQQSFARSRAEQASSRFEDAVLAWVEADEQVARHASEATLELVPDHAGAIALLDLQGIVTAGHASSPRAEALHAGVAARTQRNWAAAADAFRLASAAEPSCPLSRVLLAEAERESGRLVEAERELTTAAELLPDSPSLFAALGAVHVARQDPRAAASCFRRAAELRPRSFALRYRVARACLAFDAETGLREVGLAIDLLSPTAKRSLRDALHLQASLLDKLGRTEEAVPVFRRLVAESPGEARACFNLAYALDRLLRVREAREWYEKALAIEPHNQNAVLCLVWLLITAADEDLRDVDRAEALLLAALERDRGRSDPVQRMVRDFGLRTGRVDGLLATLQRLIDAPAIDAQERASLEHLRNNVRTGAAGTGR